MACKSCKENAKSIVKQIKEGIKKDVFNRKSKSCSNCKKKRQNEKEWLDKNPKGQSLQKKVALNLTEKIILWGFGYIPLIIGYITILMFIINLF